MSTILILFVAGVLSTGSARNFDGDTCAGPTPNNFEGTFLQYCSNRGFNQSICSAAWRNFLVAFANKNPTDVKPRDYNGYFDIIPINVERNKVLFWSDTRDLADLLSMMSRFIVSSHDIKAAQILNDFGLSACWCSNVGNSGVDTTSQQCPATTTMFFWAQFSERIAEAAEGIVFFIADGHEDQPYDRDSFFKCYEIPGLDNSRVNRLVVLNVHENNQGEACGEGSLLDLCGDITDVGIPYACYDISGTIVDAERRGPTYDALISLITEVQTGKKTDNTLRCSAGVPATTVSAGVHTAAISTTLFILFRLQLL